MSEQYLRKVGLVVSADGDGMDLSTLRIKFHIEAMDVDTPNIARIRVYNLSDATSKRIRSEFQDVMLQAGYENGNFGKIFSGTIKQVRSGRVDAVNTFVDIMAADGDLAYNFATVSKSIAAGSKLQDRAAAIVQEMQGKGVTGSDTQALSATGGVLPRGKVLFGLGREPLDDIAASGNTSWSIQNGQVVFIPMTGYLSGEALVLNSRTGMLGVPEATNNGVEVTCLLNPFVKIGGRVQIDNSQINQTTVRAQGFPRYGDLNFPASVSADGFYRVLVVEHDGDTRGDEWNTRLTCLNVDQSSAQDESVLAYG